MNRGITLVFVHLGKRKAPYLISNVKRLRAIFPNLRIVIVHDDQAYKFVRGIEGVEFFQYKSSMPQQKPDSFLEIKYKFRQGFWAFTMERLLALTQFHTVNKATSILHIESDVLVFPNFPFDAISKSRNISWCRFNEKKDVASILFLPSFEESLWLEQELITRIKENCEITDMVALNEIATLNPERIKMFPSLLQIESQSLINPLNMEVKNHLDTLSYQFEVYRGIFDPAAIGMWLCGIDPENNHGKLILHEPKFLLSGDSFIDPSRVKFHLSEEGNLSFQYQSELIPIYNLHVHSKDSKIISSSWIQELRKYINLADENTLMEVRIFRNYLRIFLSHLRDRDLIRYVCSHPRIYTKIKRITN